MYNQLFCCPAHNTAFNARCAIRGRKLFALTVVARITRQGTRGAPDARRTGGRASSEANLLIQRWIEEDAATGRAPWPDYLARRYRAGFDALT